MALKGTGLSLLCLIVLYITGSLLFMKGFMLNRQEIGERTEVSLSSPVSTVPHSPRKIIIIVIDALRIDFAAPFMVGGPATNFYTNKMTFFQHTMSSAHMFLFRADAPTTTSQRLKALVTGGLPTYIDISKNFDSDTVGEDNWIRQTLNKWGPSTVILGDDTWMQLFPTDTFKRTNVFPSFEVWDLHTVDNGVLSTLYQEVQATDHKVLIAHFLGVDHVGHTHAPNHSQMKAKLLQMNTMLHNITELLHNDDLLLVFGDHGMSETGDHGGATEAETAATLYARPPRTMQRYAHGPLAEWFRSLRRHTEYGQADGRKVTEIPQIDLVPTLSVLLGLPIPFSNLGMIIPELLLMGIPGNKSHKDASKYVPTSAAEEELQDKKEMAHILVAIHSNALQVYRYLELYNEKTSAFAGGNKMNSFTKLFNDAETHYRDLSIPTSKVSHGDVGTLPAEFVIQLDDSKLEEIDAITLQEMKDVFEKYNTFLQEVAVTARRMWTTFNTEQMTLGIVLIGVGIVGVLGVTVVVGAFGNLYNHITGFISPNYPNRYPVGALLSHQYSASTIVGCLICVFRWLSVFSNSFIVHEDSATRLFLVFYSVVVTVESMRMATYENSKKKARQWMKDIFVATGIPCVLICILTGAMGITIVPRSVGTHIIDPSKIVQANVPIALLALFLMNVSIVCELNVFPKKRILSGSFIVCVVNSVLISLYWVIRVYIDTSEKEPTVATYLANMVYLISLGIIIWSLVDPFTRENSTTDNEKHHRYGNLSNKLELQPDEPKIYFITIFIGCIYPLVLITGYAYCHAFCCFSWALISSVPMWKSSPFTTSVMAQLFASMLFFSTGHQHVFTLLHFNAGFIGTTYNFVLSGFLLGYETMGPFILGGIGMFCCIQSAPFKTLYPNEAKTCDAAIKSPNTNRTLESAIFSAYICCVATQWVSGLCVTVATFILKRHLMVWTVFTPKYCFESVSVIVSTVVLSLLIIPYALLYPAQLSGGEKSLRGD